MITQKSTTSEIKRKEEENKRIFSGDIIMNENIQSIFALAVRNIVSGILPEEPTPSEKAKKNVSKRRRTSTDKQTNIQTDRHTRSQVHQKEDDKGVLAIMIISLMIGNFNKCVGWPSIAISHQPLTICPPVSINITEVLQHVIPPSRI